MATSRSPVIGITTYGRDERQHFSVPAEYVDSVRRTGAIAVLLPPGESDVERWLALVDGVVLAGGGDVDPAHYGGAAHETIYNVDRERDRSELDLARRVLDRGVPALCICRGAQIVNVALGGTLHEHLPDVVGDGVLHRAPPREPIPHSVEVDDGSRLAALLGTTRFTAPSWHHQAVKELGRGLRAVARAPDGTIEAFEMPEHCWLYAVQWHPELTSAVDPAQQNLFAAHAAAAARERGRPR